jgi:HSP20 family protein
MFQRDDNLIVRADLPGLSKEDVDLRVEGNCLYISGERRQEQKKETTEGVYLSERSYGSFCRCVELPQAADPEKIDATFRDGVLEVTMPISEEVRGKPITIH